MDSLFAYSKPKGNQMKSDLPIIAIVGSIRPEILTTGQNEETARKACNELGRELAKEGWRIAVYSSDRAFIEQDIVTGYVTVGTAGKKSIVCHHPAGADIHFPEMDEFKDREYFDEKVEHSSDWEVSFYSSLSEVDGILLLGGGPSTLIAGYIALSRSLPTVAVAYFGGSAWKIWQQHLPSKPALIEEEDVQIMARKWDANSAKESVKSLKRQHDRWRQKLSAEQEERHSIEERAKKWDEYIKGDAEDKAKTRLAIGFLGIFIVFLIVGLITTPPGWVYSLLTILGLCFAGGMGATIRMLTPGAPASRKWVAPILGTAVGLVFSLLYLMPQLIQNSGFLIPGPEISTATRVQYISSLIVAFSAGLGFDFALEQLLKQAKQSGQQIVTSAAKGTTGPKP
jgi:hypothetical protein